MPSPWTFGLAPVKELLDRLVGDGKGWADPFAGNNLRAEYSNDLNPTGAASSHLEASEFVSLLPDGLEGALWDPPYSKRQISEVYGNIGKHATQEDTNGTFYSRVRRPLAMKVRPGGLAICFGWNSSGFGRVNGFELVEVLLLNHGGSGHNDTIITVERKSQASLRDFTEEINPPPTRTEDEG